MWPLFTQRWGPWRQQDLRLLQLPLLAAWQQAWQGCTFSSSSSSSVGSCRQYSQQQLEDMQQAEKQVGFTDWEQTEAAAAAAAKGVEGCVGMRLPRSVPVLYGE
jgi:hypothetical protein